MRGRENGVRGRENGVRGRENGVRGRENGVRGQENGVRGRENGVRGRENGLRGRENGLRGREAGARAPRTACMWLRCGIVTAVPDDDRSRRRLGDATKARIDDLAEGWGSGSEPSSPASETSPTPEGSPLPQRKPSKTTPPPPPGSAARKAAEDSGAVQRDKPPSLPPPLRGKPASLPPPARGKRPTEPPPVQPPVIVSPSKSIPAPVGASGERSAATKSIPPPLPAAASRQTGPNAIPAPISSSRASAPQPVIALPPLVVPGGADHGPATVIDTSPPALPAAAPAGTPPSGRTTAPRAETIPDADVQAMDEDDPVVPRGEFDDGFRTIDDAHRRAIEGQLTKRRDAAEALLKMPPPAPPLKPRAKIEVSFSRGDPTAVDPSYAQADASAARRVKLRSVAKLRRKRGLVGDALYVMTVVFGVRRTRAELADLEVRQQTRQQSRRRHLVTLGRTAVIADALSHPALTDASGQLDAIEDERSQHAGQVAAADTDLDRVRRDRGDAARAHAAEIAAIDTELAELATKLEPLDRESAVVQKRADALRDTLNGIARKIAATEASLVSVKGPKAEFSAVQAELAALKAERKSVERDEPIIAAELDTLNPRIAAIKAARQAAGERKTKLAAGEADDRRRADELSEAIRAKRKVVDRAVADAETQRDRILLELGERLYVDRPPKLEAQLAPIDDIDLELAEADRRIEELREILSNVDSQKLRRGTAVIAVLVIAVAALVGWVVYAAV